MVIDAPAWKEVIDLDFQHASISVDQSLESFLATQPGSGAMEPGVP